MGSLFSDNPIIVYQGGYWCKTELYEIVETPSLNSLIKAHCLTNCSSTASDSSDTNQKRIPSGKLT